MATYVRALCAWIEQERAWAMEQWRAQRAATGATATSDSSGAARAPWWQRRRWQALRALFSPAVEAWVRAGTAGTHDTSASTAVPRAQARSSLPLPQSARPLATGTEPAPEHGEQACAAPSKAGAAAGAAAGGDGADGISASSPLFGGTATVVRRGHKQGEQWAGSGWQYKLGVYLSEGAGAHVGVVYRDATCVVVRDKYPKVRVHCRCRCRRRHHHHIDGEIVLTGGAGRSLREKR